MAEYEANVTAKSCIVVNITLYHLKKDGLPVVRLTPDWRVEGAEHIIEEPNSTDKIVIYQEFTCQTPHLVQVRLSFSQKMFVKIVVRLCI